jgi:hypothetical protein
VRKGLVAFVAIAVASLAIALYAAESNTVVSVQGVLTDANGVAVPDGDYKFVFSIYSDATTATPLFTETYDSGDKVSVTNGIYNVLLGNLTQGGIHDSVFRDHSDTWLGITVENDSEMTPRIQFASTPYAFRAKYADNAAAADGAKNLLHPIIKFSEPVSYRSTSSTWEEHTIPSDKMLIVTNATYNDYNGCAYQHSAFAEVWLAADSKCELVVWEITELKGSAIIPGGGKLRLKVRGVSYNEVNVHGYLVPEDTSITPVAKMAEYGSNLVTYTVPAGKTLIVTHAFIADSVEKTDNYVRIYDGSDTLYSTILMSERKQLETPLMVQGEYTIKCGRRNVGETYNRGVGFC